MGLAGRNYFRVIRAHPSGTLCECCLVHKNGLGINIQLHAHLLPKRIVSKLFV